MQPSIRPYRPADLGAVYDICVRTADAGGDARGLYSSDRLMGDIFAAPYVTLEPEADGKHWRGVTASYQRPAGGKYLIGHEGMWGRGRLEFGIEAYYVQEGEGRRWEDAARKGKLAAEVVVTPWGRAKLKRLRISE